MRKLKIVVIATMLFAVMLTSTVQASETSKLKAGLRSVVTAVLAAK